MSVILSISQPIHRLENTPMISIGLTKHHHDSKKLVINSQRECPIQICLSNSRCMSRCMSRCIIMEKYLKQKSNPIYQLPDYRIKVMKGKFFYDHQIQRYAVDPKGWWVSEKLDGIRAVWTGCELLTRNGKKIHAPNWFYEKFPKKIALDGELYLGREQLHRVQMTIMDHHKNNYLWEKIKYYVFDVPDSSKLTFEEVQYLLQNHLPECKYLQIIHQTQINDLNHLLELQKILVSQGAEGTMLRKPKTSYHIGETSHLLKFKSQMNSTQMVHLLDDIGIVVGYKYNLDVLQNGQPILKSILVKWEDKNKFPNDPEFSVSHQITKAEKYGNYEQLFPKGQRIKVLYNQLFESQKPRFPRYGGWAVD